jgi:C4-dicarboxylate-specific signal transduction histidine kinase
MSRPEPTLAAVRAENEALRRTLDVERDRVSALEEELREARRLAAVGRAAAGVAHDVKNAMTVVGG